MTSKQGGAQPPTERLLQNYQLLHVAQLGLAQAAFFCDHLLHVGWTREPWDGSFQEYLHQSAYVTAMVIAYCRPFTGSRSWPKFPMRLVQLGQDDTALHDRLLNLRNEVYAHTDLARRAVRPITSNGRPAATEALPPMRFSIEELQSIQRIIRATRLNILKKLEELSPSVASFD